MCSEEEQNIVVGPPEKDNISKCAQQNAHMLAIAFLCVPKHSFFLEKMGQCLTEKGKYISCSNFMPDNVECSSSACVLPKPEPGRVGNDKKKGLEELIFMLCRL